MFEPPDSPYRVPYDATFRTADAPTRPPPGRPSRKDLRRRLRTLVAELDDLQRRLYAQNQHAVLLVFQALDAAGKDSTIRAVTRGVNPAGVQVFSFKRPSAEELDHDFLWRTSQRLPERGRIGIFNRSYYEEVLVVRVHPEFLAAQRIPALDLDHVWSDRFESIRAHEAHLAHNGVVILKFWLHVSAERQRRRFLARIDEPEKHWKFATADVHERDFRPAYLHAYEDALNATARPHAPWYAIPADDKPFMRATVADVVVRALRSLDLRYPTPTAEQRTELAHMRTLLDGD